MAENSPIQVDQTLRLPQPFTLYYGDELADAKVAFRLVGPGDAPVIAVLGGISAHRIVESTGGEGWWPEIVGPGLGVDTRSYRVATNPLETVTRLSVLWVRKLYFKGTA